MKKIVNHKQIYQAGSFGGIVNTTLCGRVNNYENEKNDGMNVSEDFNCHFCKQVANQHYGKVKIERSDKLSEEMRSPAELAIPA